MGYYIEVPKSSGKAQLIADGEALICDGGEWSKAPAYEAQIITRPASFADVPEGKALICVVANALFEAAGYCYSEAEFEAFSEPDGRHRTWVLMDKALAERASGYAR